LGRGELNLGYRGTLGKTAQRREGPQCASTFPLLVQRRRANLLLLSLAALALAGPEARAQGVFNVPTRSYNNQRTGANLSETILTASNVKSSQFGKLFMLPVDDAIYAQILYVSSVPIGGSTHNVIYVATTNNTVYAFDADTLGSPLWQRNFNGAGVPTVNSQVGQACPGGPYLDFIGNIGIVGTPVIDTQTRTMFFVTRTVESGATVQRLRAIDITTGADQANSPQVIQASVPGTGDGGTTVTFNPVTQNQRSAISLSQGILYIAWASFCDTPPYHGWVLAYNETTLAQVGAFNTTPNGAGSGIWMAGAGLAFDASGNAYCGTGNGSTDDVSSFGESLLKLAPSSLARLDYFTASNYSTLNANDVDFGSSGPVMLPGTNLLTTGGKEGKLYLLNTSNLGQEVSGDTQIPQVFQAVDTTVRPTATHHIHNISPTWNSPEGLNVYVWGENDFLHAFRFNPSTQTLTTPAFANGAILPPVGMPGGMMTISANGSQAGTGVLWAALSSNGDANHAIVPGNLYAFNAETLALLWSTTGVGDDPLNFSKGSIPVVANGKVYLGGMSNFVNVYGARAVAPPSQDVALNKTATGSTPCNANETPPQAVNGTVSGGLSDKWCSKAANPWLQVDLGAQFSINRLVVEHAGAGGEGFSLNTAAFNIQVSTDGVTFTTVVNVTGNIFSITTHDIAPTNGRYVRLNIVTPTQTSDTAARIYEFQVFGTAIGATPDFTLSATPASQTLTAGNGASYTVTTFSLNGFSGNVALSLSGAPSGVTASFNPTSVTGSGNSTLTISSASSTAAGTYTLTITGLSGSLQHTATVSLTVNAATPGIVPVSLSSAYNRMGIVNDGFTFSTGGLDGYGFAYSANLLGSTQTFNGAPFSMGPPNALNVIANATVALPAGQFSTLNLLATGVNGNQVSQIFIVTYTDGTTSSFTQSLSDWFAPQSFTGETNLLSMAYRDTYSGTEDKRTFHVYAYAFPLNNSKTVSSITLPGNKNVVVLAMTLGSTAAPDFAMSATPASQTLTAGNGVSYTITTSSLNGFSGSVALSLSGAPSGVTASFSPATVSGSGNSVLTLSSASSSPAGTYTLTITGLSGSLQHTATVSLTVNAAAPGIVAVPLVSAYNRMGIVNDGSTFTGGMDGNGFAYSANLLGSTQTFNGALFDLGTPNTLNVVANATVALPAGQFSTLNLLATGINGNRVSQTFTVTYTDGTTSSFTQSLSDWFAPQSYAGETNLLSMAYRDVYNGAEDERTFHVYAYAFTLNNTKTVSSMTLPGTGNVVVLALTLVP